MRANTPVKQGCCDLMPDAALEGHRARVKPLANDQVDIIIASERLELPKVVWVVLPVAVYGQDAVAVLHGLQAAHDARVQRKPLAEIGVVGQRTGQRTVGKVAA